MKKIMLLFALFLSFIASAQNFPGEKIELLKDKTLKVLPIEESLQQHGYREFYTDEGLQKIYQRQRYSTVYSALVGKEFKVISYEPFREGPDNKYLYYKLLIENPETGKLYFKYDPEFSYGFPFEVVGGLVYPEGFFCDKIKEEGNSIKYYTTPIEDGIQLIKNKGDKVLAVTVNIPLSEYDPVKTFKGITVVFDNNAKITVPAEKIKSKVTSGGEAYLSGGLILHEAKDLDLMKNHEMKSIKLDQHEKTIKNGRLFKEYALCLLNKKP